MSAPHDADEPCPPGGGDSRAPGREVGPPDDPAVLLRAGVALFNDGRFLASHELFEELWESSHDEDSEFYKGLVQASICLHHLAEGNPDGARKLYRGHRRCLGTYLPHHAGWDVERLLEEMRLALEPVLRAPAGTPVPFDPGAAPRIHAAER